MSRRRAHQNRAGVGPALATRESLQTNLAPILCSRDFTEGTQLFDGHYEEDQGRSDNTRRQQISAQPGTLTGVGPAICELRRILLPRTPVNRSMKKGRSPSVGPGPSRYADFFSGLRKHLSPRTHLRSAPLRHWCWHGDSAMLRGVDESRRLWTSALKSDELPGSLCSLCIRRGELNPIFDVRTVPEIWCSDPGP